MLTIDDNIRSTNRSRLYLCTCTSRLELASLHTNRSRHRDARHFRGVRLLAGSVVLVVVAAAAAAAVAPLNVYLTVWHRLQALGRDSCGDFF